MSYPNAWSYFLEVAAAELAVPLAEVKTWLKVSGTTLDAEITALINGATKTAENIMRRDLINKGYRTFRDGFSDYELCHGSYYALIPPESRMPGLLEIELRRSRLQSVDAFEYLVSDVWTAVDSGAYYSTSETEYSRISLKDGEAWPNDVDVRKQAVRIDFTAGYGVDSDAIPGDIKTAIKMHVANAFANHGDCPDGRFLPPGARGVYIQNRIMEIGV